MPVLNSKYSLDRRSDDTLFRYTIQQTYLFDDDRLSTTTLGIKYLFSLHTKEKAAYLTMQFQQSRLYAIPES